jgi:zinc transporter 7
MVSRRNRTLLSLSIFLGVLAWNVAAAAVKGETGTSVSNLSVHEIEEQLQVCCAFICWAMSSATSTPIRPPYTPQSCPDKPQEEHLDVACPLRY